MDRRPLYILVGGLFGLTMLLATAAGAGSSRGLTVPLRGEARPNAPVVGNVELYGASHALVIGIDIYTHGWPRLSLAVEDATRVAASLRRKGFDVTLRTNLDSVSLRQALEEFFISKGSDPAARLFVWFAGHGYSDGAEGFLVPADAPRPDAGTRFKFRALPMRRFGEYVRLAESKHVFAVFDSCFSGTVFDSARALPSPAITRATTLPVRQFLTSGDAGQSVSDDGSFRELFLRALEGDERADSNSDGFLTASEMGLFLADRVTNLTQSRQTPRYGKLRDKDFDQGDFVFALPAGARTGAPPPPRTAAPQPSADVEIIYWQSVQKSRNPAAFEAYLRKYPNGAFAELARLRISELKPPRRTAMAGRPVPRAPKPKPKAKPVVGVYKPNAPGSIFKDCPECPQMVVLPAGSFRMGHIRDAGLYWRTARPVHRVAIAKPFAMSRYEVTFAEFDRFSSETGQRLLPDKGWGRGRLPALRVPREDALAYAEWLSEKTGKRYRLPPEAEWEYGARAGTETHYWWGDSASHEYANYGKGQPGWFPVSVVEGRDRWKYSAPVGSFPPNAFGLYDMNGNLWEHVLDCFHDNYKGAPSDGSARMDPPEDLFRDESDENAEIEEGVCTNFVLRGGSWGYNPSFMMSATRVKGFWAVDSFLHYGVRLVRELE